MTDYVVKIRFWLRAYDSMIIAAATDAEAFHMAKAAARHMMTKCSQPEEIDLEDRHDGLISYVDRLDGDRTQVGEASTFAGDRPFHSEARRFITELATMDDAVDPNTAASLLQQVISAARALPADDLPPMMLRPANRQPWSADAVYTYSGDPRTCAVRVEDDDGVVHVLDPRLDLRNHSPTGFAWGYGGSGPAQLALAILCHALHSDERAEQLYQDFKDAVIAPLAHDEAWRLTTQDVLGWVLRHPTTSNIANCN